MRFFDASVVVMGVLPAAVSALSAAAWRSQSVYQVWKLKCSLFAITVFNV